VVEGREWIEALPASLERQAALLSRLLDLAEADRRFRAFEIQCSIARGAGDELSDLDVAGRRGRHRAPRGVPPHRPRSASGTNQLTAALRCGHADTETQREAGCSHKASVMRDRTRR
jgi:hypothetical protein